MLHSDDLRDRWGRFSLTEQLGNVGSEVGRANNWLKKGDKVQGEKAWCRALDLLDFTVGDARWRGRRRQELARWREALVGAWTGDDLFQTTLDDLEKYFFAYAIAARA